MITFYHILTKRLKNGDMPEIKYQNHIFIRIDQIIGKNLMVSEPQMIDQMKDGNNKANEY